MSSSNKRHIKNGLALDLTFAKIKELRAREHFAGRDRQFDCAFRVVTLQYVD